MNSIERAVSIVGSQTRLAQLLGVRQNYVSRWVNLYQQAPAKYIRKISRLTNGEVTAEQLLKDHEKEAK